MSRPRSSALTPSIGVPFLVFVAAWMFRWLSMGAIENDHFVALARAHQVLHGDWPVRDFADPGQPLAYLSSAAAAWLFDATLRTDVVLSITLLSLGASLTYVLAARASGSVLIGVVAAAVEVAAGPRLYNGGKILLPLAAVWLGWRYADAPSRGRLIALAAWTATAGLWRHDLMVYVAAPTLGLLTLVRLPPSPLTRLRRPGKPDTTGVNERRQAIRVGLLYVALTVAFLLPWLIYVQWVSGIGDYLGAAFRFAATEANRTVVWAGETRAAFAAIMAIPVIAVVLARRADAPPSRVALPPPRGALRRTGRRPGRLSFAHVAFAASMALIANIVLLRDVIATRLPDVIGLTVILAAWIAGRTIPVVILRATAGIALAVVGMLVGSRLASEGYGLPTPGKVARRFAAVSSMLRQETAEAIPNREREPLIRYLASCTPATSRVLVSGFAPEIPVLARRPFAGGLPSWIPGYGTDPRDVERAAAQLARETVSMAVMLEGSASFIDEWPRLAADLRARNLVERTWTISGREVVVWIPADVAARAPSSPPMCGAP